MLLPFSRVRASAQTADATPFARQERSAVEVIELVAPAVVTAPPVTS